MTHSLPPSSAAEPTQTLTTATTSTQVVDSAPPPHPPPTRRGELKPRTPPRPPRESARCGHQMPFPFLPMTGQTAAPFGENIQMVMSFLRTVKSYEISEFARDLRS
ncbi:hypothetical protein EVAR_87525_1 [Eumeta japonica]|uniref:Uncharacterized protein n=1 Tax=Eumeta variegata TaxID=151549 RepID=A0A4C1XTP0_EUMVA|nr:hypothetical protein EVAR_87525_1 [Eumeta japonica]